ncbi:hypothetical protein OUZ56_005696 [Daphnia magna]|uniref:Uncharacterized protein n=1 Tax=Daphnia magna TaxID=35525 RepID=A0ABQ9YTH8_9CRUS|nr:hypothetical protein OUZ56_005696 [Daphnia magna]
MAQYYLKIGLTPKRIRARIKTGIKEKREEKAFNKSVIFISLAWKSTSQAEKLTVLRTKATIKSPHFPQTTKKRKAPSFEDPPGNFDAKDNLQEQNTECEDFNAQTCN